MNVRRATPADAPALHALALAAPTAAHWVLAEYERVLASVEYLVYVADDAAGHPVGFVCCQWRANECDIENIVVRSTSRRRRIGSALFAEVVREATTRGTRSLTLEVRASSAAAIGFYHSQRFSIYGRRPGYYQAPEEEALLLKREL